MDRNITHAKREVEGRKEVWREGNREKRKNKEKEEEKKKQMKDPPTPHCRKHKSLQHPFSCQDVIF